MASAHLLHMIWGRTRASGAEEDLAMCTFNFYAAAASWPSTAPNRYEEAEIVLNDFWTAIRGLYKDSIKLQEYRWYREDDLEPPWGPPARVTGKNVAGGDSSASKQLPPQVALAVTEWTGLEERQAGRTVRHWGRFYLPAMSDFALAADGTVASASQTNVANAVDTMYAGMTACGLVPAVRITGWGGTTLPDSGWAPVKEIRVDNLWDTIRRRRYETVTSRLVRDTFGDPVDPDA